MRNQINQIPQPEPELQHHSLVLEQKIQERIRAQAGWISFAEFMEQALYAPGWGYYVAGLRKFGPEGDFITAPELSPLFGQTLAQQFAQIKRQIKPASIFELGAGSGKLAATILQQLAWQDCLPETYYILEISPELRLQQAETLQQLPANLRVKVKWLDNFPTEKLSGLVLANEFLDALPVNLFHYQQNKLSEIGVGLDPQQNFVFKTQAPSQKLQEYFAAKVQACLAEHDPQLPYISECNLQLDFWLNSLRASVDQGLVVFIDYGFPRREYYHPQRLHGTLMCHYRHFAHTNPFFYPGLQDLTAHVDFTHLAEVAQACGWEIAGYFTQADYLLGLGIDQILTANAPTTPDFANSAQQLKKLVLPHEMGELFKVLLLNADLPGPLSAALQAGNRLARL